MGRKLKRGLLRLVAYTLFLLAVLVTLAAVGLLDGFVRSAVVTRIERLSGGRVEMEGFRFHWLALRAELEGLTIHGREPEGTPPLFHAKRVLADARVISMWSRKVALDELILERPEIHVRIDKEGHSNFSGPATASQEPGKPLADRMLELQIGKLRFNDGEMLINDVRVPLAAEGGEFRLAVDFHPAATTEKESYTGEWSWKQLRMAARRYLPVVSDVGMKITLTRTGFRMDEFKWTLPHSRLEASAALASYAKPDWTFQYRAGISLTDIRDVLRKPHSPAGQIEVSGAGKYQAQELHLAGEFDARDVALPYEWFHAEGIRGRGKYEADTKRLRVTDIQATALGGETTGQVEMIFEGQQFRAETKSRGVSLAAILAAVEHEKFPLTTLHWESRVDAEAISMWSEDFKHFRTKGNSVWSPAAEPATVGIPTAARLQFDYSLDQRAVDVGQSEISTSATRLQFTGRLGLSDSQMNVHLEARDLLQWNDFINSLRGVGPESDTEPKRIAGNATWDGRITGHLDAPQFSGHATVKEAAYEELYWDDVEGQLTYSPEQLRLEKVRARRGKSSAGLDLWLDLYDWSFRPENEWSFTATLNQEDSQGMQEFLGWKYPARAMLTGEVHGGGTRGHPEFSGRVAATGVEAWGWTAERLSGEFRASREELQVSNAEIQKNGGQVRGSLLYRAVTQEVEFDGNGAGIQLDKLEPLQGGKFSIGGELSFQVRGRGAIAAPVSQGTMKLANLRVGKDTLGTLEGDLRSDGRNLHATLRTEMSGGEIAGKLDVVLGGAYPVAGDLSVKNVDLDFLSQSAFRLESLSG
ncbi:MAG: hypothetical protein HY046_05835, partial [Acidobacteria bacterium]|nr:hypothetical protein [Acidobacteriota bacterium]